MQMLFHSGYYPKKIVNLYEHFFFVVLILVSFSILESLKIKNYSSTFLCV